MICIIAGNYKEAQIWARGQALDNTEWFCPYDKNDILSHSGNFHVLIIGTSWEDIPIKIFDEIYQLAKAKGRIGRE